MSFNFGGMFTASENNPFATMYITEAEGWDDGYVEVVSVPLILQKGSAIQEKRQSAQEIRFTLIAIEGGRAVLNQLINKMESFDRFTISRSLDGKSKQVRITRVEKPLFHGEIVEISFECLQTDFA